MDTLISILWDPEQRTQLCYAWILDLRELRDLKWVLRHKFGDNLLQSEKKNPNEYSIILAVTDLILFSQKASHLPKQLVKHYLPDLTSPKFQNCTWREKAEKAKQPEAHMGHLFCDHTGEFLAARTTALRWHGALPLLTRPWLSSSWGSVWSSNTWNTITPHRH